MHFTQVKVQMRLLFCLLGKCNYGIRQFAGMPSHFPRCKKKTFDTVNLELLGIGGLLLYEILSFTSQAAG